MALTKIKTSGIADNAITNAKMADDAIDSADFADASIDNVHVATGLDAVKLADGSVTNAELQYINSLSSNAQTQISAKLPLSGGAMTGAITTNSTFDGVDIATRDGILSSTTTTANAALPKAGGTMTGNIVMADDTSIGISDSDERIEFDGAGDISVLGANVGIGTDSPGAKLVVNNSGASLPALNAETVMVIQGNADSTTGARLSIIAGTSDSSELQFGDADDENAGAIWYTHSDNSMNLRTGGSGVDLTIDSSGNVGIGTTAPSSAFGSAAPILNIDASTDNNPTISFGKSYNSTQEASIGFNGAGLYIDIHGHATATNNVIVFRTEDTNSQSTPTERMRIDSNGTVLLNTPANGSYGYLNIKENGGGDVRFGKAPGNSYDAILGVWSNNDVIFYSNSTEAMRIKSDGRGLSQFTAKAWVNINGTAASPSIRDSHNISSIDDNNPGNYDANFTVAMADTNYVAFSECQANHKSAINSVQTTYMQILIRQGNDSDYTDSLYGFMVAFGD